MRAGGALLTALVAALVASRGQGAAKPGTGTPKPPRPPFKHEAPYAPSDDEKGLIDHVKGELAAGKTVNEPQTEGGLTWLHVAATRDFKTLAQFLVDKGANVKATTKDRVTSPLVIAAALGHTHVAEVLLRNGAAAGLEGREGLTPMFLAMGKRRAAMIRLLQLYGARGPLVVPKTVTPDFASPEAAARTFVLAILTRDVDVLSQCIAASAGGKYQKLRDQTVTAKSLGALRKLLEGAMVAGSEPASATTATAKVLAYDSVERWLRLVKEGAAWKVLSMEKKP